MNNESAGINAKRKKCAIVSDLYLLHFVFLCRSEMSATSFKIYVRIYIEAFTNMHIENTALFCR